MNNQDPSSGQPDSSPDQGDNTVALPTNPPASATEKTNLLSAGVSTNIQSPTSSPPPSSPPPNQPPAPPNNQSTQEADDSTDEEVGKPLWRRIVGFIIAWILVPLGLVFIVHNFIFQAWYVDGQSMEPTFQNSNYLIVSKFDVSWKKLTGQSSKLDIKRGDVIIFNPPNFPTDIYFIKRAIGLPGERIVIKDGTVTIFNSTNPSGVALSEDYVGNIALEGEIDTTVGEGEIFVLGDNRNPQASQDSRYFGPIPMRRIIGSAVLRLLPVYEFGQIQPPQYNTLDSQ